MKSPGKIFFLCPDVKNATGGVTKIYEFASALSAADFSVAVVHHKPDYRPSWFSINVPVVGLKEAVVGANDVLVVPEFMSPLLPQLRGCAKIILNQNVFAPLSICSYDDQVLAVVSTSEYISRQVRFAHPQSFEISIRLGYDKRIFNPDNALKKKQIAYMPRRRGDDAMNILQALERRGSLEGWSVKAIDGLSVRAVSEVLRESMLFLSFSKREGFGLPPLEAMACGCLVLGFHGLGGAEFFDASYCYPIPEDDICLFQETLEELLLSPEVEAICKAKGEAAAVAVSSRYTMQRQDEDVVKAFSICMELVEDLKDLKPLALCDIRIEPSRFRLSVEHLMRVISTFIR